jgi:hypothetical protein
MPIGNEELKEYYHEFQNEEDEEFATLRFEKKQTLSELLGEDTVTTFEEGDIRELVRNLWAFESWNNKDYIVEQILEDGLQHARDTFHEALYEVEDINEKFNILNENVNMLGPASVTEILTFKYPEQCAIFNRRAGDALDVLDYGNQVPDQLKSGTEYEAFLQVIESIMERLTQIDGTGAQPPEIQDYVDVDYFLFYLSKLDLDKTGESSKKEPIEDFVHDEMQDKLLEIGDGLGFDVDDEYQAAPGARIDVRWSTRVANLGMISYAFEVHRRGSRDSAILNLQKAQNADPTLQKLVIVSTQDQLVTFKDEIEAISTDFSHAVSYLEVEQVNKAVDLLADLKEILQDAGLMRES